MERQIKLHNRSVNYSVRRSNRAKRMRLAVYLDGNFVVTLPKGLSDDKAQRYLLQKSNWILSKIDFFKSLSSGTSLKLTGEDFEKYKNKALEIASETTERFNRKYGFKYNKISVKNLKTRWGSCSKKKNLNFNYKIVFLSQEIVDYIVIHELCHLKEFNHSNKFWNLVAKVMPEYKDIKNDLRYKGLSLS